MTTLREAAQQALEALRLYKVCYGTSPAEEATLTALRAALAEPVQEPVAWADMDVRNEDKGLSWTQGYFHKTPLYTAPPQRKPLTEEEIDELAMDEDGLPNSHLEFARAIERAHGIGGQDEP